MFVKVSLYKKMLCFLFGHKPIKKVELNNDLNNQSGWLLIGERINEPEPFEITISNGLGGLNYKPCSRCGIYLEHLINVKTKEEKDIETLRDIIE
jgi:hypothetical protein